VGGKHASFSHLRRLVNLTHLPVDLLWRRDYDSHGRPTVFLLLPATEVPWERISAALAPHMDVEGLPRGIPAVVPGQAPLSAEQAKMWSERYWPTIFNPASQVLQDAPPLHQLRRVQAALDTPAVDRYMGLARTAATEVELSGHGMSVAAVVVDPHTNEVVAVAGDARWWSETPARPSDQNSRHGGRPEHHALMRAVAMVANQEVRRRMDRGSHGRFMTGTESPAGRPLTEIEQRHDLGNTPSVTSAGEEGGSRMPSDGYLCSGLDVYLTHEPCVCCAMAMIHSRFRACVFGQRMPGTGGLCAEAGETALGYGLFWRRELNWRVMAFEYLDGRGRRGKATFHA